MICLFHLFAQLNSHFQEGGTIAFLGRKISELFYTQFGGNSNERCTILRKVKLTFSCSGLINVQASYGLVVLFKKIPLHF